ncbi:MAG: hypothetical protein QW514_05810 [Thermoprotei archaeon]
MATKIVALTKKILADRRSGSTTLAKRLLNTLIESKPKPEEAREAIQIMASASRDMLILHNVAEVCSKLIQHGLQPSDAAEKILNNINTSIEHATNEGVKKLGDYSSFLTLSNSDQLLQLFMAIEPKVIYILESRPGGEGTILASKLKAYAKPVKVAPDLSSHILITRVECVVVGTDGVYDRGFVNKLGTGLLACLCAANSKPFYALTTKWKTAPTSIKKQLPHNHYHSVFEWVNNTKLSSYICELGELSPHEAYRRLRGALTTLSGKNKT